MGLQGLVQAHSLTSLSTKEEAAAVMNILTAAASKPKGKGAAAVGDPAGQQAMLLYCTPEKIVASKRLMSKLERLYQVTSVVCLYQQRNKRCLCNESKLDVGG